MPDAGAKYVCEETHLPHEDDWVHGLSRNIRVVSDATFCGIPVDTFRKGVFGGRRIFWTFADKYPELITCMTCRHELGLYSLRRAQL